MEGKVDTSTKPDSQIMRELGIDRSDAPRLPKFSLRITLYLALMMLILAAAAIVYQQKVIDQQRQVIRDISGVHFSDGKS